MDLETARFNMIEQQIRPWEVLDQRVLDLFMTVKREHFVPEEYRALAFADTRIPLPEGQQMMAPKEEGRMLQALQVRPRDEILEIGTGSGFVTALLARSGRQVTSVEYFGALSRRAAPLLREAGIDNVTLVEGDGLHGWAENGPYDVIAVTASMYVLDESFIHQLKPDGRLFVVVGEEPAMEATLITRTGADDWTTESLFETVLPPLIGAERPVHFEL